MRKRMSRSASVKTAVAAAVMLSAAACTPLSYTPPLIAQPQPILGSAQNPASLASDLSTTMPDTTVVALPPGTDPCGQAATSVVRGVFPDRILFATASDEPAANASGALDLLADRVKRDVPGADITVLGHTDAVGSDAYNMDLSRRRALRVLTALMARGIDPSRLSAVAIGKRQPIADDGSEDGRARNRRVEFLISGCLAANLTVVRQQAASGVGTNAPVDVVRLDPSSAYGLATIGAISLRQADAEPVAPAAVAPAPSPPLSVLKPPVSIARPAPAPHYQPRSLPPDAQPNPLGPAVPF